MKKIAFFPLLFVVLVAGYFSPFFFKSALPIPSDTIIGLYNPYRDLYAKDYQRGLPFKNFLITDPVRQQYPWRELAISVEKKFELPLWNPYSFSGTPFLANFQTAAFYPLNILFFILPFEIGWSLLIIIQPLLAGLFLYFYLRHHKLSKFSSLLGGIVFGYSGFFTAWLEWGTIGNTAMWLPLVLLSIDKILTLKRIRVWSLLFLLSLISAFFAGHLQTFVYLFVVSLSYFFVRWFQFGKPRSSMALFSLLLVGFVLVTWVQWYPTLQFILQSARDVDQLQMWQKPGWFIPWQHLIQFIAPDFFGNPTTLNYWGEWNYGEFVGYTSILPLLMALFAMYNRQDKKTFFFGVLFFLSLIFSLPTIFAQLPYILNIPFLSTTQPTRLLFLTDFSLAVLAALGLDSFLRVGKKRHILYSAGFVALLFLGLWVFVMFGKNIVGTITPEQLVTAKRNLLLPTVVFGGVCISLLVAIFLQKRKKETLLISVVVLLLLITVADLFRFSQKFNPFTDKAYLFPTTETLNYLQKQDGPFRIMTSASEMLPPNFSVIYRLQSLDGYDPLYLKRYGELMAAIARKKPDIHSPFGFNRIITPHTTESRLIDLLGVKYVLSLSEIHDTGFAKVHTEGKTVLYKNNEAFPRAFFVDKIIPTSSKQESVNALFDEKNNLHTSAIVENWYDDTKSFGNGSANIVEYKESKVIIQTQNQKEGFLVLMDTFYPTWHARICEIDGSVCKQTKIYVTNYNFRGIVVPRGKHEIQFYITLL